MKRILLLSFIAALLFSCKPVIKKEYSDPAETWGELYQAVLKLPEISNIKSFWDASPREKPDKILALYQTEKDKQGFDLSTFLQQNFDIPDYSQTYRKADEDFETYVQNSFKALLTKPRSSSGSLFTTRMYFTAGGGQFDEYNYFTSFFALKAFQALKEDSLASKMAANAFQFIQDYGYVPYGNRTYYVGFSDFPVLSFLAEAIGDNQPDMIPWFANLMGKIYQTEMAFGEEDKKDFKQAQEKGEKTFKSVVFLGDQKSLNRYYNPNPPNLLIDLLKTTEWGNSTRFTQSGQRNPEGFIPVDLNGAMYQHELMLAKSFQSKKQNEYAESYQNLANIRKNLVNQYLYNPEKGFYYDYDFDRKKQSEAETLAAVFPLLTGMSSPQQAKSVTEKLKNQFLTDYGLLNDLALSTGSAEMNYLTILALRKVGENELAETIKQRWIQLNRTYYRQNGHILRTYNLFNPSESNKNPERLDGALGVLTALLNE